MINLDKNIVHLSRQEFFDNVVKYLSTSPKKIDEALEQIKYYFEPNMDSLIHDVEYGDFYIEINPFFAGKVWHLAYSMWQIGKVLKIAVILQNDSEGLTIADPEEMENLWPGSEMTMISRGSKIYLEWTFDVPDFHVNFATREGYALGMRHLHFRVLKSLRVLSQKLGSTRS